MNLQQRLLDSIDELKHQLPRKRQLVLAFSGGRDSTVLLHLLWQLRPQLPFGLRAVHANHGLSPNADDWQRHCEAQCRDRAIPLQVCRLGLGPDDTGSIEMRARQARYQAFSEILASDEVLLTAHHLDDQAETVLLQLMRGSGPRGLAGIPRCRELAEGHIWRPLLDVRAEQLAEFASEQSLNWVTDESNQDLDIRRNHLRLEVAPRLADKWPAWRQRLGAAAEVQREADELLQELAESLLEEVRGPDPNVLRLESLLSLSSQRQRLVLRQWLWSQTGDWPSRTLLLTLQAELLQVAEDAQPLVRWQGFELRRYGGCLYLIRQSPAPSALPAAGLSWPTEQDSVQLPGNGVLIKVPVLRGGLYWPAQASVQVTYRQGGEQAKLPGRPRKSLKKVLNESRIQPWLRDRTPLLWIDGQLAWVAGVGPCEGFQTDNSGAGFLPQWIGGTP